MEFLKRIHEIGAINCQDNTLHSYWPEGLYFNDNDLMEISENFIKLIHKDGSIDHYAIPSFHIIVNIIAGYVH